MRYDIRNLNIWKDSGRNQTLVRSQYKTVSKNGKAYPLFLGDSFLKMDIANIPNLSVRSYNCLRRRGWNTVGDIVSNISSVDDIRQIRNCGKQSSEEIFEQLISLQNSLITSADKPYYDRIYDKINGCDDVIIEDCKTSSRDYRDQEGGDIKCKILQM